MSLNFDGMLIEIELKKLIMGETLLQSFLNNQFIKTSIAENITGLSKAVNALKRSLSTKRSLIINYILVALDPQISEHDQIVLDVERLIIKNWPTFKNSTSTKDKATTYVRVVILQALVDISKDELNGALIWLSGRNAISYYKIQKEKDVLVKMLVNIGSEYEINSRKYWSVNLPKMEELEEFRVSLPTIESDRISVDDMINLFKKATIYKGWKDQTGVGGFGENPSYAHNSNWDWEKFFSEKAGADLTPILNKISTNQDKSLSNIGEEFERSINEYFSQVKSFFSEISTSVGISSDANSRRSNLLWWKQTLYSPILNNSYRNQSLIVTAITMAWDISQLIGNLYPESTNYLLREALYDVHGDVVNKEQKFHYWIKLIKEDQEKCENVLSLFKEVSEGRKSLITAMANILASSDSSFFAMTGIEEEANISLSDFIVWMFNDMQAKKISLIK